MGTDPDADRTLFGWRIRSVVPLPDLLAWTGEAGDPDIVIDAGPILKGGREWVPFSPAVRIGPSGEVRLAIPSVADFLIHGNDRVTVDTRLPLSTPDIRVFLLGSVLTVLCYRRGLLPLHASAVDMGNGAVLIAGQSGAGKSTLAAALAGRGGTLVSDDLCALTVTAAGETAIWPGIPRLKLWRDAMQQLAISEAGLERSRARLMKFHVPVAPSKCHAGLLRPAHLVVLSVGGRVEEGFDRISATDVMQRRQIVHRWRLGQALGHGELIFKGLAALARTSPATDVLRTRDIGRLPSLAERIAALAADPTP